MLNMVSTHQQYLCPDFLPLSSVALDSNKSPLALLAQTCNSIGLPEPSSANGTKSKTSSSTNNGHDGLSTNLKLSCKDENNKQSGVVKPANQPADSTSDSATYHSNNNNNKNAHHKKTSNNGYESHQRPQSSGNENDNNGNNKRESSSVSSSGGGGGGGVKDADTSTGGGVDSKISNNTDVMSSSSKCLVALPPQSATFPANLYAAHCFPSTSTTTPSVFPFGGHNAPAMPLSYYSPYHLSPAAAALPTLFPRLCTDPFCKSCPPNPGFAAAAALNGGGGPAVTGAGVTGRPCPLGCAQCTAATHPDLSFWLNSYSSLINMQQHGGLSGLAANPTMAGFSAAFNPFLSGLYNNNNNNNNVNNGQPMINAGGHICNWLNGDKYCGKVFASAEELLQHLRGHTHESSSSSSTTNGNIASTTAPSPGHVTSSTATTSGRLSPRSAYLSSLHSLRYHPYSKLPSNVASGLPPHLGFPPLNPSAPAFGLQSVLFAGQRLPHS